MVFDYFSFARAKQNKEALEKTNPQYPVLKQEDEQFLERIASSDVPKAPLPPSEASKDHSSDRVQVAKSIELPEQSEAETITLAAPDHTQKKPWSSYVPQMPSKMPSMPAMPAVPSMPSMPSMPSIPAWRSKQPEKSTSAQEPESSSADSSDKIDEKIDDSAAYPAGVKVSENVRLDQTKADEDEKEVSVLLDRLNLSSINNRVFSFSAQSQQLYEDFTVVLKDMISGGPTAYHDMEKLMRDNDAQLREMYNNMPPFVQTLVKSLPIKLGSTLGPEILAAASEKPGADMKTRMEAASRSPGPQRSKSKGKVPNVQSLANEKGAVTGMLKSTVSFFQARFPAFVTGTNVIMSLAVFILLFVFWYCHKRGRETRLQREAGTGSASEVSDIEQDEDETAGQKADVGEVPAESEKTSVEDVLKQPAPADIPLPEQETATK